MKADQTGFIPIKIIFLGPSNTGKTSIINRYVNNTFPELHDITVGIDFYMKTIILKNINVKLELWDTWGVEAGRTHAINYANKADACVFVMDISKHESMEQLAYYITEYKKTHTIDNAIIIGNKSDHSVREITLIEGETFANEFQYNYYEISAKQAEGTQSIYSTLSLLVMSVLQKAKILKEEDDTQEDVTANEYLKKALSNTIQVLIYSIPIPGEMINDNIFFTYLINDLNEYNRSHICSKKNPKNFEELKEIIADVNILNKKLLDCLKLSSMPQEEKTLVDKGTLEKFFSSCIIVKDEVCKTIYYYHLVFIKNFLSKPYSEKMSMILLEKDDDALESLSMKKKELMSFFDNEYIRYKTSKDLHEYFQFKGQVERIIGKKQRDVQALIKGKEIQYFQDKGDEMMRLLKQYRNAFNDRWDKVTMNEIKLMNYYQIEEKIHYYGYKCYLNYKTAYQYADKDPQKYINEQIRLRANVSLAYSMMGYHLKANFYVLSANLSIFSHPSNIQKDIIAHVIKIGTKISQGLYDDTKAKSSFNYSQDHHLDDNGQNTTTAKQINSELKNIHFNKECLQLLNSIEGANILNVKELKNKIYKNIFLGLSYQDKEFSLQNDSKQLHNEQINNMSTSERNVSKYLYWLVIPGLIAFGVMKLLDKMYMNKQLKQYQLACERLNKIYTEALEAFKKRQYGTFLEELSQEYSEGKTLIMFSNTKGLIQIEPAELTVELLKYAFRPDDIAQLFNLIGISLLSLCGDNFKRNKKLAIKVFNAGLDENLVTEANELDNKMKKQLGLNDNEMPYCLSIEGIRNSIRINLIMLLVLKDQKKVNEFIKEVEMTIQKMKFFPMNDQLEVAKDVISALYGTSFYEDITLQSYGNNGRINDIQYALLPKQEDKTVRERYYVAAFAIKMYSIDEFDLFNTISKGKYSSNKGAFIALFENKFSTAKGDDCEFMRGILSSEDMSTYNEWKYYFGKGGSIFKLCYIRFFSKYFGMKVDLYRIANEEIDGIIMKVFVHDSTIQLYPKSKDDNDDNRINIHLCIDDSKENILAGFILCNKATDDYEKQIAYANTIEGSLPDIANRIYRNCMADYDQSNTTNDSKDVLPWYYYESLHKLSLYKEMITNIKPMKNKEPHQWKYLALAERKLGNIQSSVGSLKEYLRQVQPNTATYLFNNILQEMLKIKNLGKDIIKYYNDEFDKKPKREVRTIQYDTPSSETHRILSLDGGGIRCIIQLIILSEIELITEKSICELFDTIIGTSTGAFIAACLCIEDNDKGNQQPKYKAYKILELLMNHQECLFWEEENQRPNQKYKYSHKKKEHFFKQIFGERLFSSALTNLQIPLYDKNSKEVIIYDSAAKEPNNPPENEHKLINLIMAATAIPTLFPSVKYDKKTLTDASCYVFNPTIIGLKTATHNSKDIKRTKVLSIGSGYYPLMPNEIFWKEDNKQCAVREIDNGDTHILSMIGEYYVRIQVQLLSPIGLDSLEAFNQLVETTREYMIEINLTGKMREMIKKMNFA